MKMSCITPLENVEHNETRENEALDAETESLSDNENFSDTVLGGLLSLISNGASILEDAEDLLEDCYQDRKALLECLSLESQSMLEYLIDTTLPDWYGDNKNAPAFNKIISFSKHFVKEGTIVQSLLFLLTLRKEFAPMFQSGKASFLELQTCYERLDQFLNRLTPTVPLAPSPLFSREIDALILWLEEHQTALQAADNITMEALGQLEESDCNSQSTSLFINNLYQFCNDLEMRLVTSMLIYIDDTGRMQHLCPPDDSSQDRSTLLLEQYSQDFELKIKIDYLIALDINVGEGLKQLDRVFQNWVSLAKHIDNSLGHIKRISYLSQNFDPRVNFSSGFCAGDGINWSQNMLDEHHDRSQSSCLRNDFSSRATLHSEQCTDNTYRLQMRHLADAHLQSITFHIILAASNDAENVKQFCVDILNALQVRAAQNNHTVCFEVYLFNELNKEGHYVSFCRFFRTEVEVWRVRDVNYGEFEGNFCDLRKWYSEWYSVSGDSLECHYNIAALKQIIPIVKYTNTLFNDTQYRKQIAKNKNYIDKYSMFADDVLGQNLTIYQIIASPTTRDNLMQSYTLFLGCVPKLYANPKQAYLELDIILRQILTFADPQYKTMTTLIQIAQCVALLNDSQLNAFITTLYAVLSSINLAALEAEDAMMLNYLRKQIENVSVLLAPTEEGYKCNQECNQQSMINFEASFTHNRKTIEHLSEELIDLMFMNPRSRGMLKRVNLLLDVYAMRLASIFIDNTYLREDRQFDRTSLEEEAMHPSIEKAMEIYLHQLKNNETYGRDIHQESIASVALTLLLMRQSSIPRSLTYPKPLIFMKAYQDEMKWQKWTKEYKEPFPGKNGFGPGAVVSYHSLI